MQTRHLSFLLCAGLTLGGFAVSKMALARGPDMAGGVAFPFGPNLSASGWQSVRSPWRRGARFSAHGKDALVVETAGGFGLLWHAVPRQVAKAEQARWRWRKQEGVGPTDLTKKGGDDRVLAPGSPPLLPGPSPVLYRSSIPDPGHPRSAHFPAAEYSVSPVGMCLFWRHFPESFR